MKQEVIEIIVNHPEKGEIKKKSIVTYDEEIYSSGKQAYDKGQEYKVKKADKQNEFDLEVESSQKTTDEKDALIAKADQDFKNTLEELNKKANEAKAKYETDVFNLEKEKSDERSRLKIKSDEFAKWQEEYPTKGPDKIEAYVEQSLPNLSNLSTEQLIELKKLLDELK